ncbi:DUF4974 domain-containing protein [Tunicatimonas pelagia]|uniref:DUF4974 domain-containing protein n=1 Tax=Tunicatimonas pelagia TaxID=931531 RepID=UPI00266540CD|nr:DUF4974 domain-containing protein [Tunicatimonas pelagia]WKN45617.1 DUF4974 domain-containing protein [Tunicatimonas pelagia]
MAEKRELIFRDQPLTNVCDTLSQHFSVVFTIKNKKLKSKRVTARFSSQSLDAILQDLSFILNIRYEINGDHITIRE